MERLSFRGVKYVKSIIDLNMHKKLKGYANTDPASLDEVNYINNYMNFITVSNSLSFIFIL